MSTLRSAIDELDSDELARLDNRQLLDDTVELRRHIDMLEARWLQRVAEIERRQASKDDGHISTTAWLRDRCRMAAGTAREHTRVAGGMRRMPGMREAFLVGDLDMTRVRDLVHARKRHPDEYDRDEEVLVSNAEFLPVEHHRKALAYWAQALDHEEALEDSKALYERRRWHQSTDFLGMGHVDADLDPETDHLVRTAIATIADPANIDPEDTRTPAQVRHDAVTEIVRFFLDHAQDLPTNHGERPHASVIVDYQTLIEDAPGLSETEDGHVLHPETVRRMLCDAKITRIITGPEGSPLDVGRTRRTVTPAQWKALVIRDGGCVHPGCGRPPAWCDVHHKLPWSRGGATDLDNLELRCRLHHRLVHEGTTRLSSGDGENPNAADQDDAGRAPPHSRGSPSD